MWFGVLLPQTLLNKVLRFRIGTWENEDAVQKFVAAEAVTASAIASAVDEANGGPHGSDGSDDDSDDSDESDS